MDLRNSLKMKLFKPVFLIIVFSSVGCANNRTGACPEQYGLDYNENRIELGLPVIEPEWVIHECDSSFVYWSNRQNRVLSEKPSHLWKRIYFSNNTLLKEEDVFHFESTTDKAYRLISSWYPDNIDSTSFRLITFFKDEFPPTVGKEITLLEADSLLKDWGLKPLSFGRE